MLITTEIVKKLNPCTEIFENFTSNYPNYSGDLQEFLKLDKISFSDKVWVFTHLATQKQNQKFAILCAKSVLHIFEEKYPEDKRPRAAIEAAEQYLANPTEENKAVLISATNAARAAADAARAADAAYNAYYAANAAADSAYYAYYAAYAGKEQEILQFMLEV